MLTALVSTIHGHVLFYGFEQFVIERVDRFDMFVDCPPVAMRGYLFDAASRPMDQVRTRFKQWHANKRLVHFIQNVQRVYDEIRGTTSDDADSSSCSANASNTSSSSNISSNNDDHHHHHTHNNPNHNHHHHHHHHHNHHQQQQNGAIVLAEMSAVDYNACFLTNEAQRPDMCGAAQHPLLQHIRLALSADTAAHFAPILAKATRIYAYGRLEEINQNKGSNVSNNKAKSKSKQESSVDTTLGDDDDQLPNWLKSSNVNASGGGKKRQQQQQQQQAVHNDGGKLASVYYRDLRESWRHYQRLSRQVSSSSASSNKENEGNEPSEATLMARKRECDEWLCKLRELLVRVCAESARSRLCWPQIGHCVQSVGMCPHTLTPCAILRHLLLPPLAHNTATANTSNNNNTNTTSNTNSNTTSTHHISNSIINNNSHVRITDARLLDVCGAIAVIMCLKRQLVRCLRYARAGDAHSLEREWRNEAHTNWSPRANPQWLVIQLEMDIIIRATQVRVAQYMIDPPPPDSNDSNDEDEDADDASNEEAWVFTYYLYLK